jgi:hypothetical protein
MNKSHRKHNASTVVNKEFSKAEIVAAENVIHIIASMLRIPLRQLLRLSQVSLTVKVYSSFFRLLADCVLFIKAVCKLTFHS